MTTKRVWYYKDKSGGHEILRGPITKDELLERLNNGVIDDKVLVRHEYGYWMPLHQYLSDKKEETKLNDTEWQALKSKIQWDNLKAETKNTRFVDTKREQKIGFSTPRVVPLPLKRNKKITNNKVIIISCIIMVIFIFFIKKNLTRPLPNSMQTHRMFPVQPSTSSKTRPPVQQNKSIFPVTSLLTRPSESIVPITSFAAGNQQNQRIKIVMKIVYEYHQTHTYSKSDYFVCADMAIDVWNMVKTKGINAVLVVGNVKKDITNIREANHVWVSAEVSPGQFVAMETTGGFLVCPDSSICPIDDLRYFNGWIFNNPREFKDAQEKIKHPCPAGYVLGADLQCHKSCGENAYCTGNSVCVEGRCRRCNPGYYLGTDLRCHKS